MTREQIEKAAMISCASKDEVLTGFGRSCFIEGAQWRINSVWHDASEKPNGMFVILIDFGDEVGAEEYGLGITTDDLNGAKRWAYVSDLIPERKEVYNESR